MLRSDASACNCFLRLKDTECCSRCRKSLRLRLAIAKFGVGFFFQNGFFTDFSFSAAGFFCGRCRSIFSPQILWEKVPKKILKKKSPAISSKIYTTNIPNTFLQRGWADEIDCDPQRGALRSRPLTTSQLERSPGTWPRCACLATGMHCTGLPDKSSDKIGKHAPDLSKSVFPGREVPNGVGADGVGVKFPIFPVNCSRLPLFQENRQKTKKNKKKRKSEEKRRKTKKKGKIPLTPSTPTPLRTSQLGAGVGKLWTWEIARKDSEK